MDFTHIHSPLVCAHPRKLSPDCPVFSSQFCLFSYRLCTDRTQKPMQLKHLTSKRKGGHAMNRTTKLKSHKLACSGTQRHYRAHIIALNFNLNSRSDL